MAVDVPESFIARNKTPPRYPPPRPPIQVNHIQNGAMPQVAKTSNGIIGGGVNLDLQPLDTFGRHRHNNINNHNHHSSLHKSLPSSLDDNNTDLCKKSSASKAPSSLGSTCDSIGFDSMSYRTKSRGSLSTRSSSSGDLGPPEYDLGPHRELPVDVPDSFVEIKKAPPRYPPPKPPQIVKEVVKNKSSVSSHESTVLSSLDLLIHDVSAPQMPQAQAPIRNNEVFWSKRKAFFIIFLHFNTQNNTFSIIYYFFLFFKYLVWLWLLLFCLYFDFLFILFMFGFLFVYLHLVLLLIILTINVLMKIYLPYCI